MSNPSFSPITTPNQNPPSSPIITTPNQSPPPSPTPNPFYNMNPPTFPLDWGDEHFSRSAQKNEVTVVITEQSSHFEWKFLLKKKVLSLASTWFKNAARLDFTDDEIKPEIFRIFVAFIKTGEITAEGIGKQDVVEKTQGHAEKPELWYFDLLVELYIFAEQYEARGFKQRIFDIIRSKCLSADKPFGDDADSLSPTVIGKVCEELPRSSPLRRLLANVRCGQANLHHDLEIDQKENVEYPAAFLGDCLSVATRRIAALMCDKCGKAGDGSACYGLSHGKEDAVDWREKDARGYFE